MRIVSLLPAATEWVAACGALPDLVGRSHACDAPPEVRRLPALTRPARPLGGDSPAIDRAVQGQVQRGLSLYAVDTERLRALAPDLVLTQAQCDVCAVPLGELEAQLAGPPGGGAPKLLSLEPATLKQVVDGGLRIGRAVGRLEAMMQFIGQKEERLQALQGRLGLRAAGARASTLARASTVACIEWMEPLMTAGHWTPGVIEQAGGRPVLAEAGGRSPCILWAELRRADPEVLLVAPCGFGLGATRRDLHYLTGRPGWNELRAVREGRVYLFDGSAYFNRPGPRLYRTIELVAAALHAARAAVPGVRPWEMQPLADVAA